MAAGAIEQRALEAACAVAGDQGLPCSAAEVLSSRSNVLVHLRPSPVVARVMTGTVVLHDDPERWLTREVSVLSFLATSGLAVRPSSSIAPGPHQRDGLWMTFVDWVPHENQAGLGGDAEEIGRTLRNLHDELAGFPGELADLADLQGDIDRLLGALQPTPALTLQRLESLRARLRALSETAFAASLPVQALHGDASLGNMLSGPAGRRIWNDFEDTFRGPVHWDVAGYLISLRARGADSAFVERALDAYGGIDPAELAPFFEAHDLYDEIWQLYDAQRRST